MKNWRNKLDVIANIALIICCVLFIVFLVRNYLSSVNNTQDSSKSQKASLLGKKLTLTEIDWSKNQQTLLLVLQKGCHFCDESMSFYQRLVKQTLNQSQTKIIALFPQDVRESKQYLHEKGVEITDVRQIPPTAIGVRGTPTAILVNNMGIVVEQWSGKLPPDIENDVLARLKQ